MNKLTSIRIKYKDGTYSDQIPIGAFAENIRWDNTFSLKDILGQINFKKKGSIQGQIDEILIKKIDQEQLSEYVNNQLAEDTTQWLNDNVVPAGSVVVLDNGLTIEGAAADAKAVGDQLNQIKDRLNNASIDVNDLGLYQDSDTGFVYPTYRGVASQNGIPLAASGGGGGGGGGDINNAILTVSNTSGWLSKTIAQGAECTISLNWSSLEDEISTGNGSARITVNNVVKGVVEIRQGDVTINIAPYLTVGSNTVKVRVSDIYDNGQTITFNIVVADFSITSTFVTTTPFTEEITFPFTPVGEASKTIYFILDGVQLGTLQTTASNRQLSYKIPAQSHGSHTLRCYFEVIINEETIRSNQLYFEFMFIQEGNNTPVIASSFNTTSVEQFSSVVIPYKVYSPASATTEVELYLNNALVSNQQIDRTEQSFTFRANTIGTNTFKIQVGSVSKTITLNVTQSQIHIDPVTQDLVLYLTPTGRSNNEALDIRQSWSYGTISSTLTGFNWKIDGWLNDDDGITVLRTSGDARVTIPYKIFEKDFKTTGKTIQIEFATRNVSDYTTKIISCMSDNIGLELTSQEVTFKGAQTSTNQLYKENQHVRISFVVEKQTSESRLILIYINGVMSRAIQYASGERFTQPTPVDITIGSNDCDVDIYNIRIYDNDLTRKQILDNWIADTQIGSLLVDRYTHNNVYDEYDNITISNLPNDLPYMILEAEQLPQFKGDKKVITGSYTDPVTPSNSFTFNGCQSDVQGTSSAPYFRKNYDMKFKKGFITKNGQINNYSLRKNSIPFNRFVLKADVASSESTNNTGLTMFYHDTCPYRTPEMQQDSRVRWGIEGVPIVVYWYNTNNKTTTFLGKYNFNLPKRAAGPLGYSGNMQSWEWQRNNSDNVKFKDDDFTSTYFDNDKQTYVPVWYQDFEARMPSDEWRDYTELKELVSWVKSTAREQATNETFETPITYRLNSNTTVTQFIGDTSFTVEEEEQGGNKTGYFNITFTKDTPAYRLTKFRAEVDNYFERESVLFYYLFTELFLMIDSRAKNMFIGFRGGPLNIEGRAMTRKAVIEPYDMDTAIGTNNSGVLMFGYFYEDIDTVSGLISGGDSGGSTAPVYNAQDSILWNNVRDALKPELILMYRQLRANNSWSYNRIKTLFENHQAKWPEAIFNEDAFIKYIYPVVNAVTVDEDTGQLIKTTRYLTMLQGSKAEQRKWWLYNRFKYLDSKYVAGSSNTNVISARLFADGPITITPNVDSYAIVQFGGGNAFNIQRTTANTPVTFNYVAPSGVTEMETYIYSADNISDIGDMSGFFPNEVDFSKATKLKRLKLGDKSSTYTNPNLKTFDISNSPLLESVDVRNCPNLTITVDLQGSPRLKEAYFDNTAITGVDLVDGCPIETLHLPSTVTALTLMDLNKLTDFTIPSYGNITRLFLSNIDTDVINPITVLQGLPANALVNIQGLDMTVASTTDIDTFYNLLDTMKGVTRQKNSTGAWIYTQYDKAQIVGTIYVPLAGGAQIAAYKQRYPYINIDAVSLSSTVTYKTYDGSSTVTTETVVKDAEHPNPDATYSGKPSRTSTAQYNYTFSGWSTTPNGAAEANAQKNIQGDRILYAAYTATVRTYTVYFYNGSTLLETDTGIPYGGSTTYDGATPVDPSGQSLPFEKWEPAPTNITGNTSCYAQFQSPVEVAEITDSWDTIIANIDNGTYATKYKIGNYKPLDLGTEGVINMQIVAMDADELADGSGYAPLTFIGMELLTTTHHMNATNEGGWPTTEMRSYLLGTIKPLISSNISSRIQKVNKTYYDQTTTSTLTGSDTIWIPSAREMFGGTSYESSGVMYTTIFKDSASRIKNLNGTANIYWLRSARSGNSNSFRNVSSSGNVSNSYANNARGVCVGFCLGLELETIEDSWSTILANTNPSASYSIGDTKSLLINGTNHLMQIVAFNSDVRTDGNGTVGITWVEKDLFTTHRMNATSDNTGGWPATEMRSWLRETVLPTLPEVVRNGIVEVNKTYYDYNGGSGMTSTQADTIWIPSAREMFGGTSYEGSGVDYTSFFNGSSARIKNLNGKANIYWLRSASSGSSRSFHYVYSSGDVSYDRASRAGGVCVAFCTN